MRWYSLAAAFLALLSCTGCGHPSGNLIPLGAVDAPGNSQVDMLVVSTRSSTGAAPGIVFTGARGALAYADLAVSVPPDSVRQIGEVQWPDRVPGDPTRAFVTLRADRLDSRTAIAQFRTRIQKNHGKVLVFIHGFNTRFEEAVYRLAQFAHDSGAPGQPILFTWPSRGSLLAYAYDRESANYSRDALETLLRDLQRDSAVTEISILAHSMGNWVTLEALRQMAIRDKRIAPKIRNVMLAAPDVDVDVFQKQIVSIGDQRPPFVLFTSREDLALSVSSRVSGSMVRLGSVNPNVEPYKSELARDRIIAVDLTDVRSADRLGHSTFAESPEIVRRIGMRLAAGQQLEDTKVNIGEKIGQVAVGAASTVGQAAGLAISAPVSVFDPQSRESFGSRFEEFGNSARDTVTFGNGGAAR